MIGRRIAHFEVVGRLGSGGMGVVYRATDVRLDRSVALKLLEGKRIDDPAARARLLREARMASRLDHPNVGTVYEVGEWKGASYIAMALYEGESLSERIARGPLPLDEVEVILRQVAAGLGAAHAAGVVHRDLKPANVLLAGDGMLKIVDFGLAIPVPTGDGTETRITRRNTIVGSPRYMAPEQLRGEEVDVRTDLWSLGVLSYELLAGTGPFRGASAAEVVSQILQTEPAPIATRRPDVTAPLRILTERLLVKDPGGRLASAELVPRILDGAHVPARGGGLRAIAGSVARRPRRWPRSSTPGRSAPWPSIPAAAAPTPR